MNRWNRRHIALGSLGRYVCAILWLDEVSRTEKWARVGICHDWTQKITSHEFNCYSRNEVRQNSADWYHATGTRQHLFGHLVEGFLVEPRNESSHRHIDHHSSL